MIFSRPIESSSPCRGNTTLRLRSTCGWRCIRPSMSGTHTVCPWKGTASYYSIIVAGKENRDAVWYYPQPSPAAEKIRGRMAFWRGVKVVADGADPADESPPSGFLSRLVRSAKRAA